MMNAFYNAFFDTLSLVFRVTLFPIDVLIASLIPDSTVAFESVNSLFTVCESVLGFVIDLSGLSSTALSILITYFTMKLTGPLMVHGIKFVIKWIRVLK